MVWLPGLFAYFRHPNRPPSELRHLLELRRIYVERFLAHAVQKASLEALDTHLRDVRRTLDAWRLRAREPLPEDVGAAVARLLARYEDFLVTGSRVRKTSAKTLADSERLLEGMLATITELARGASAAGIDIRAVAIELDVEDVQRQAEDRVAEVLLDEGATEPDEELAFLERFFGRSMPAIPTRLLS